MYVYLSIYLYIYVFIHLSHIYIYKVKILRRGCLKHNSNTSKTRVLGLSVTLSETKLLGLPDVAEMLCCLSIPLGALSSHAHDEIQGKLPRRVTCEVSEPHQGTASTMRQL